MLAPHNIDFHALQQIDELANIGKQGEKGENGKSLPIFNYLKISGLTKKIKNIFTTSIISELLTRLKDAIFADNWEIQVFQVTRLKYRFYCYCIIVCFKRRRTTE